MAAAVELMVLNIIIMIQMISYIHITADTNNDKDATGHK